MVYHIIYDYLTIEEKLEYYKSTKTAAEKTIYRYTKKIEKGTRELGL